MIKQALITGADGFIGSHLCENLVQSGYNVRALVYYNSWESIGNLKYLSPKLLNNIEIIFGDIRDYHRMKKLIEGTTHIFHLSSLIGIPYSYMAAESYIQTNIIGTLNILEAAKENKKLEKIIHTSTSEVYGSAKKVPMDEEHPQVAQSPYSASKISADKFVESYYRSFDLPVVTVRPFNTYGPRQTPRAVIPTIISQLISKKDIIEIGDISPRRDFVFVEDTADAMKRIALSNNTAGEVFNVGTGKDFSIEQIIKILFDLNKKKKKIILDSKRKRPKNSEVSRLLCDNTKLKTHINWVPQVKIEDGLRKTLDWFKSQSHIVDLGYKY